MTRSAAPALVERSSVDRLDALEAQHPEWASYLAVVRHVVRDAERCGDIRITPGTPAPGAPFLHDAVIEIDTQAAAAWLRRLFVAAGTRVSEPAPDTAATLEAAIARDPDRLAALAAAAGVDPGAFRIVADLAALPLMHAARTSHERPASPGWNRGFCLACGAWPTLAEARGLDRTRRLRCARCGGDWPTEWLRCAFCDNRDHLTLDSLVTDATGEARRAETCQRCDGYLKTLPTLAAIPALHLLVEDLETLDLDLAALAHGRRRPDGLGFPIAVTIATAPRRARRWSLGGVLGRS